MLHELPPASDRPSAHTDITAPVCVLPHSGHLGFFGLEVREPASSSNWEPQASHRYSNKGIVTTHIGQAGVDSLGTICQYT
jgi:hypothetical protein